MIYDTNIIEFILNHWLISIVVISVMYAITSHFIRVYKINSYKKRRKFRR